MASAIKGLTSCKCHTVDLVPRRVEVGPGVCCHRNVVQCIMLPCKSLEM